MPRFRLTTLPLIVLPLAIFISGGCKTWGGSADKPTGRTVPMTVLRTASGSDAAVCTAGEWLINSDEALAALGSSQLNDLGVDFVTESLVVITLGEQPTGGYWLRIEGVSRQLGQILYGQPDDVIADDDAVAEQPVAEDAVT